MTEFEEALVEGKELSAEWKQKVANEADDVLAYRGCLVDEMWDAITKHMTRLVLLALETKPDAPLWDGTDAAHPAWWRGNDQGVAETVRLVNEMLDGDEEPAGVFGYQPLNDLRDRLTTATTGRYEQGYKDGDAAGFAEAKRRFVGSW